MNKARIIETGEIVNVVYDDDDLYLVEGRGLWLRRNEFEYVEDEVKPEETILGWQPITRKKSYCEGHSQCIDNDCFEKMFPTSPVLTNAKALVFYDDGIGHAYVLVDEGDEKLIEKIGDDPHYTHFLPLTPPKDLYKI